MSIRQNISNPLPDIIYPISVSTLFSGGSIYRLENRTAYTAYVALGNFTDKASVINAAILGVNPLGSGTFAVDPYAAQAQKFSIVLDGGGVRASLPSTYTVQLALISYAPGENATEGMTQGPQSIANPSTLDVAPNYPYSVALGAGGTGFTPVIDLLGWNGVIISIYMNPGFSGLATFQFSDVPGFGTYVTFLSHAATNILATLPRLLRYFRILLTQVPDGGTTVFVTARRTTEDVTLSVKGLQVIDNWRNYSIPPSTALNMYMPANPPVTRLTLYTTISQVIVTVANMLVDPAVGQIQYTITVPPNVLTVQDVLCSNTGFLVLQSDSVAGSRNMFLSTLTVGYPL